MDDDDYGSAAGPCVNPGSLTNSALRYAAFDIEFQEANTNTSTNGFTVVPTAELLAQNYPNPFNPETTIAFDMVEDGNVSIEVFNVRGQKVKTLVNEHMTTGDNYTVVWEGTNDSNQKVSSGIYFYKMKAGNYSSTKKMILMK